MFYIRQSRSLIIKTEIVVAKWLIHSDVLSSVYYTIFQSGQSGLTSPWPDVSKTCLMEYCHIASKVFPGIDLSVTVAMTLSCSLLCYLCFSLIYYMMEALFWSYIFAWELFHSSDDELWVDSHLVLNIC